MILGNIYEWDKSSDLWFWVSNFYVNLGPALYSGPPSPIYIPLQISTLKYPRQPIYTMPCFPLNSSEARRHILPVRFQYFLTAKAIVPILTPNDHGIAVCASGKVSWWLSNDSMKLMAQLNISLLYYLQLQKSSLWFQSQQQGKLMSPSSLVLRALTRS